MYKGLSRAQLSYDYLHTNSTTHEFLFGALAELLDNARDASATKINIYSVMDRSLRGGYMLCFLDDGQGMSPEEASDIITFGKSTKKSLDSQLIGMYGNGLKSGSMRIGNDFILFTKKGPTLTCVFLSRTFHENEQLDEIIVPMPSFDSQTKKPFAKTPREKEKHLIEMELILKYSPFKTEAQFMKEFDKIEGTSGCLVIIYNLKLLDSGEPELDVKTDLYDIILSNPEGGDIDSDEGLMPERKSFRAYASILYVEPRMRVYIQGKKVRTKRLISTLYKPRVYRYSSARFKARSENEVKKAEEDSKSAENRAREAESKARNLELKTSTDKDQRAELRRAQAASIELRKEAQIKKAMAERKAKSLRDPKQLVFVFGVNIDNRSRDGMFVYNCSRLIKMYQKVGPQAEGGVFCSGVIGVVDVPYLVLEPTHNKQDFADAKEYRHLQQAMGEHMVQYWKDMEIAQQGVTKFWESFGYVSPNWRDLPSNDPKYVRKRTAQVQITLQCDLCLKWRIIPFSANNIGKVFPDDWVCSMNPDPSHNRCSSAEEKLNLPEGVLKKMSKSKEQKEKDLQQEIKKKQVLLEKLQKHKTVSSSRTLHESSSSAQSSSSEAETDRHQHPSRQHPNTSSSQFTTRSQRHAKSQVTPASREKLKRQGTKGQRGRYEEEESSEDDSRSSSEEPVAKKKVLSKSHHGMMKRSSAPATVQRTSSQKTISTPPAQRSVPKTAPAPAPLRPSGKPKQETAKEERSFSKGKKEVQVVEEEAEEKEEAEKEMEMEEWKADEPDDGSTRIKSDELGTKVKAFVLNKWVTGEVVAISQSRERWRVKLENSTLDATSRWYDKTSRDIKVLKSNKDDSDQAELTKELTETRTRKEAEEEEEGAEVVEESAGGLHSPSMSNTVTSQDTTEIPTSSTIASSSTAVLQANEEIANGYRTCLRYFLPPQWVMDKDAVSVLGIQELAAFPLDDFFDHYEKGLRKLVSSFQQEAQNKQAEAEQAVGKLSTVRKMIAKLLKTINEEFEIDSESDSDQVDELLALCLRQALAHARNETG